jgi:uncharacterized protein YegL
MATKTIYSLVIDRSGSMADIRHEIFGSINNRIRKIIQIDRENDGETLAEITTFNHRVSRIVPLVKAEKLKPIKDEDFLIDGTTALFDALGSTLERLNNFFREEVEKGETDILIIIYTDGYENASMAYSKSAIRKMMTEASELENVQVTLVGCDEKTLWMAKEMAFHPNNIVRTSKEQMARSMGSLDAYFEDYKKGIKPNFKSRYKDFDLDKDK